MSEKEFIFEKTVYLGDTNMFGNVYFARYFDWQGEAREDFLNKIIPNSLSIFRSGVKFVTIEASVKYNNEALLFNEIAIKVRTDNIKITTLDLIFTYINKKSQKTLATGREKIGFVDSNNKVIPIPQVILDSLKKVLK
jgi:YbgC/YbaW family acyl-CoA thioester hydrolase